MSRMGCCFSKHVEEKQVVYMSLAHTPHTLSTVTEISQETEIEVEPMHI